MNADPGDPVVLTGCGWVTPFAAGPIPEVLASALEVEAALFNRQGYWAIPDDLGTGYPELTGELRSDRGVLLTAVAMSLARRNARLTAESYPPERVGLVLGCALAGQLGMIEFANEVRAQTPRFVSPIHFPQTVGNYIAGALARGFQVRGPNSTIACGVASGLDAIVEGCRLVSTGRAEVVIAGGTNQLSPELAEALTEPGSHLSEGACLFTLESKARAGARGVSPMATVVQTERMGGMAELEHRTGGGILSGTTAAGSETVVIEYWVGQCLAGLGAAVAAAAIGAAAGCSVPQADLTNPSSPRIGPISTSPGIVGVIPALIFAPADNGPVTALELTIPAPA